MSTFESRPNSALLVVDMQNGVIEGAYSLLLSPPEPVRKRRGDVRLERESGNAFERRPCAW